MREQELALYLPMDRQYALVEGTPLPESCSGATLFADISGFTPLTEALARSLGPRRGAEELLRQLNYIYDVLIAEVNRYGGSVIGFSGDAITCWFQGDVADTAPEAQACSAGLRAVACALAMQSAMAQFAQVAVPGGMVVTLAMKAAVAAGEARRFLVGDSINGVVDVLAGSLLEQMAAAEQQAEKGEVVLHPKTVGLLGGQVQLAVEREGFGVVASLISPVLPVPWVPLPPQALAVEEMRPWLLAPVFERILSGQGEFLAELRPAVALFLRFQGIDYDNDPDAGNKLDRYIRWVQGVLAHYQGALIQLTIGDKGSYLYAAFGAPMAHADSAERAVATAWALLTPPYSFITAPQIGISGGRMRVGSYGGSTRRTYGVLGEETNMAARLMGKAAPGEILVNQRLVRSIQGYVLEPLPPVKVKGRSEPLPLARVLGPKHGAGLGRTGLYAHALVGREAELGHIEQFLVMAASGVGQLLRLEGAMGIGKSHLMAEVMAQAQALGFQTAVGLSQEGFQSRLYAPWREIFRTLLGLDEGTLNDIGGSEGAAIEWVEGWVAQVNPDWQSHLPLLGDLLGLPIPDTPTTAAFDPKIRQTALGVIATEIIQRLAQLKPLLLVLEDTHWMDEASQALTLALGRSNTQSAVLLVMVQRPAGELEQPLLPAVAKLPHSHHFQLQELTAPNTAKLVQNLLDGPASPLALSLIEAETDGNPFFIEELVRTLRENEALIQTPQGRWTLAPAIFEALRKAQSITLHEGEWVLLPDVSLTALDVGLPDSVQGLVLSRLDRLPETLKLTLKVASVLGRACPLEVLDQIHPLALDQATLYDQMILLEIREFVTVQGSEVIFKHSATRDVTYDTLLFEQRRQLHHAVAAALEVLTPQSVDIIAMHSFQGEDWRRAVRFQLEAGRQAQQLFATEEAVDHFRKALYSAAHLPPDETAAARLELHLRLGELLTLTSHYEAAREQLELALALAEAAQEWEALGRAYRWMARTYELKGEAALSLEWVARALDVLAAHETVETAELLLIAGLIYTRQGAYDQAVAHAERGLEIAQRLGALRVNARTHNLMGLIKRTVGESKLAIEYVEQALALYRQAGDLHGQALVHNNMAGSYNALGQWTKAEFHYRQAVTIFNRLGDSYQYMLVMNNLSNLTRFQGALEESKSCLQEALRAWEQSGGALWMQGVMLMNMGATFLRAKEWEPAHTNLTQGQEYLEQTNTRSQLPEMYMLQAEAALLNHAIAEAEDKANQAVTLARELKMRGDEAQALRTLGNVARAQGKLSEAEQHQHQSVVILTDLGHHYEAARSRLALGRTLCDQGQQAVAFDLILVALTTFEQLGAKLDAVEARALLEQSGFPA